MVKMVSSAATGYFRHVEIKRGSPVFYQIKYDPIGMYSGARIIRKWY